MTREVLNKILDIQDAALQDEEYIKLHEAYVVANKRFNAVWNSLPKRKADAVYDFLYVSTCMYHRLMELACTYSEQQNSSQK